jgi:transposase
MVVYSVKFNFFQGIHYMNNYPLFFKICVVNQYLRKDIPVGKLLTIYNISKSSLYNWIKLYNTNLLQEKKKYTKKSKYTDDVKQYIKKYVVKRKIFNYKKLIRLVNNKFKITISKTAIYDILKNMGVTHKRMKKILTGSDEIKLERQREEFRNTITNIDTNNVICIDETSIDSCMIPVHGWSLSGERVCHKVNATKKRYSIICAISNKKVIYYKLVKENVDAVIFKNFMEHLYENHIHGHKIVLDNARIHHAKIVKEYMDTIDNEFIFNAPYTPDYNPIEKVFGKLKRNINKSLDTSIKNLFKIVKSTFKNISSTELNNYYRSSFTF